MKKFILLILFLIVSFNLFSQDIFEPSLTNSFKTQISENPKEFKQFTLNKSKLLQLLSSSSSRKSKTSSTILSLPNEKGEFEEFRIFETSVLGKELAKKYPTIKSYVGKSVKGNSTVRFSYSPSQGFVAALSNNNIATVIIKPTDLKKDVYVSFLRTDILNNSKFECETIEKVKQKFSIKKSNKIAADNYLRKYRLAVATTAEYSSFFLDGSESDDLERKTKVLAAINTSLTRINGIFERDFSVTMELVGNNDEIIYLDALSDPFNTNYNQELQQVLDNKIGDDNYDVGHLFVYSNNIYGNAGCIACVCTSGAKGSAFTAHSDPSSDHFNMIASHEFGHQFGGYHVQSSSNCRSSAGLQEVEPGSGSSIMGYAGICDPNVQDNPDDYFNYVDIRDVLQWTRNDSSCAELIATENSEPSVSAGKDFTIPKSTAFVLEGNGSDTDEDNLLTYCWEQNDPENPNSNSYPQSDWVYGPLYRSKLPVSESYRYFPQLSDIVSGNLTPVWEVTPSVSRTLDFVVTVRDNAVLGAKTSSDETTITVDDKFGPFVVTSQESNEIWNVGETKTITWNVGNTTDSPISVSKVDLFLSLDGGLTFNTILLENTDNDGIEEVIIPVIEKSSDKVRLMIKARDNVFLAVNKSDFKIQNSEFAIKFESNNQEVCIPNVATYNFTYNTYLEFNEETTFSIDDLPTGVTYAFTPETAITDGTQVELTISNLQNFPLGKNDFIVKSTTESLIRKSNLILSVYDGIAIKPELEFPTQEAINIDLDVVLSCKEDNNSLSYLFEISDDEDFLNIVETETSDSNSFIPKKIDYNNTYYWRVKSNNGCGSSDYSDVYSFTTLCKKPSNVIVDKIQVNSAVVNWTEEGNSSSWEIEVVKKGEVPSGSGIIVENRSYKIEDLLASTEYEIFIRSYCSELNTSAWLAPISFKTLVDYCGEKFYDSGGENGDYESDERIITRISPNGADVVEVTFLSFDVTYYDFLYVFDGEISNSKIIGSYSSHNIPTTIRSSFGNDLIFYFISDSYGTASGWEAEVNCITVTCPEPENIIASNIKANSVDLNWDSNGDENQWQIELVEFGSVLGEGTKLTTKERPYTIEGLKPNTQYDIYVKAICGDVVSEDDSFWSIPIKIETPCGVYKAPYFYDVESVDSYTVEDCWTSESSENANYFWSIFRESIYDKGTGPEKAKSGEKYFGTYSYSGSKDNSAILISPTIDLSALKEPVLDFYTFMYGLNVGSLHVDIFSNNTWTLDLYVLTGEQQQSFTDQWKENIISLEGYSGEVKFRFRAISGGDYYSEIDIDDISVTEKPTCITPTLFEYTEIGGNSVDLSWLANGEENSWEIEYGETDFKLGEGTKVTATTNPFTLNDLNSLTNYDIYLRAVCGSESDEDNSKWVGPLSIKTGCGINNAPYNYDVESSYNEILDCWSITKSESSDYTWESEYTSGYSKSTGPSNAHSGNRYFGTDNYPNSGDETILYSPSININNLSDPVLNFYSFLFGENINSLHIDIYNYEVWTEDVLVLEGQQQESSYDLWDEHLVSLSEYEGVVQVRFRAIANVGSFTEVAIDDISFIEMPTCLAVKDIEATNITSDSVDLNWISNGDETSWEIEYGSKGYTVGTGTGTKVSANTNPFTLTGLSSETQYDIHIRAVCGTESDEDNSKWSDPISIETPCGVFDAPFNYDVENHYNSTIEDCWSFTQNENSSFRWESRYTSGYSKSTGPSNAHSGNRYFGTANYSYSDNVTELITPSIDISSLSDPVLNFYSFMFGSNIGKLHIDIYNKEVWTEDVLVLEGQQQESSYDLWDEHLVSLSAYEGVVQVRFRVEAINGYYNEVAIDDISFIEMPTCIAVKDIEATSITYNSVDLSWISNGDETSWEIEYGAAGNTVGTGTKVTVNTNPFALTGLSSETQYDIYVRAVCGTESDEDNSKWSDPITIETPCGIFDAPFNYDVENQYNSTIEDCWSSTQTENSYFRWESKYTSGYSKNTGPSNAHSGNRYFGTANYSYSGNVTELITPSIDISSLSDPVLNFYSYMYGSNIGKLHVDIYNNKLWTEDVLVLEGQQQESSYDLWNEHLIALSAYEGVVQVRFRVEAINGSYNEVAIDDISFIERPTCLAVKDIEATNIALDSVDLSWISNGDETSWEIEYGAAGYTVGTGTGTKVTVNTNPFTLTDLSSKTQYDIYVRAACGSENEEGNSKWAGPISIETPCGVFDAPFNYDVENHYNSTIEDCWSFTQTENSPFRWESKYTSGYSKNTGPSNAHSGNRYFGTNYFSYSNNVTELITPSIDISSLSDPVVNFYSFMYGSSIGKLHIDIYNNEVWTEDVLILDGQQQESSYDLWDEHLVSLSAYGGVVQVRFRAEGIYGSYSEVAIDDISFIERPTCIAVKDIEATNITSDSVDLSWISNGDETSWEIEYGSKGYTVGTGTKVTANTNPFTITSLSSETQYDIYVRAVCGTESEEDNSKWSDPISIETPCGIFDAPFNYDVESHYNSTIEDCWTSTQSENSSFRWESKYTSGYSKNRGPSNAHSGNRYFGTVNYAYSGHVTELITPSIDISSLSDPALNFYSFMYGSSIGKLHIDIYNNEAWTEDVLVLEGQQQESSYDLWDEHLVSLSAYEGVVQVRFRVEAISGSYNEVAIDDISFIERPTCLAVKDIKATNITYESVDLDWVTNGDETSWEIEYGSAGYTVGTGTKITSTTNPFTLTGLSSETQYDIYVRAVCGTENEEDNSKWSGPISIETPCGVFDAPFNYDVENHYNSTIEDCWSFTQTENTSFRWESRYTSGYGKNTGPSNAHSGNRYFGTTNYAYSGNLTELITPSIDISSLSDPALNFYSFMFGSNIGKLHVDIYNNKAWTEDVLVLEGQQQESSYDLWDEHLVSLSAYEGVVQVRFRVEAISGGSYNEVAIDDISFIEMPTCIAVKDIEATNITSDSVDLSWIANGDETSWEIEYGAAGYTVGTVIGTKVSANTNPFTLTGLSSETQYDIYVRAVCGTESDEDNSKWSGPISIETQCGVFDAPFNYDVENHYNSTIEDCWSFTQTENTSFRWESKYTSGYGKNTGPSNAHSGNRYFGTNYFSYSDNVTELITPSIDISSLSDPALNFYSFMFGSNIGKLHVDIYNNEAWTEDVLVLEGQQQESSYDLWDEHLIALSAYEGVVQVRFRVEAISGSYNEVAIDDISFVEMPLCLKPSDLTASNITYESIDLNWMANGSETSWEIEYSSAGYTVGTGTKVIANSTSYTLTNLETNLAYDIYVRAICGAENEEDKSKWIGILSIETEANYCGEKKFYDSGGKNGNYKNNEYDVVVIEPKEGEYVTVNFTKFDIESCCDYLTVYDGSDTNSPYLGRFTGTTLPGNFSSTHSSGSLTFQFSSNSIGTGRGWEADVNCVIPTCFKPTDFQSSSVTYDSVDLSWNANGNESTWEIEYGDIGYAVGTGTKVIANSNPYKLTGLSSETQYDIHVRAVCGTESEEDNSKWSDPITIETPCGIFDAPFNYDVENHYNSTIEDCWTSTQSENSSFVWQSKYTSGYSKDSGPSKAHSGNRYFGTYNYSYSGNVAELLTPSIDISSLSDPVLNFYSFMFGSNIGDLHVDIYNNEVWTEDVLVLEGQQQESSFDLWDEHLIALSDYEGIVQVRFRVEAINGYYNEIAIDDISIIERPTCLAVKDFEVININHDSVDLSWIANGSETSWEIEYESEGYTAGTGTKVTTNTNPFTLTNLSSETQYDIYIRAVCGIETAENNSKWVGPISIETSCGVFNAPFLEDAEDYSLYDFVDECWTVKSENENLYNYGWITVPTTLGALRLSGSAISKSGNKHFSASGSGHKVGAVVELLSSEINISQLENPMMEFYSYMYGRNIGSLQVDVFSDNNWVNDILVIEGQHQVNSNKDEWDKQSVDLSNYSDLIKIRFRAIAGGTHYDSIDIDYIRIDDASVLGIVDFRDTISNLEYHPNPVNKQLTIKASEQIKSVIVFNILGQEVYSSKEFSSTVNIDFTSLAIGTYSIKVFTNDKTQSFRVVKK